MNKALITTCVAVAALGVAISLAVWRFVTITEPYVVKPLSVLGASKDAKVGYSVKSGTRTLSIISSNRVVVVADPGASFHYDVIWLVERPREDGSHALMQYTCNLPGETAVDHINGLTSNPPEKIARVCGKNRQWN